MINILMLFYMKRDKMKTAIICLSILLFIILGIAAVEGDFIVHLTVQQSYLYGLMDAATNRSAVSDNQTSDILYEWQYFKEYAR